MTDVDKLRELAKIFNPRLYYNEEDGVFLYRIADLLDSIPPETLAALKAGTWKAVPVESTYEMQNAAWHSCFSGDFETYVKAYRAMLAAAPEKPE